MADGGFGASITFESSFFAQVTSFSFTGAARAALPTTHMTTTTGDATFLASDIKDRGSLEVEFFSVANTDYHTILDNVASSFTFTYPIPAGGSVAATLAGSAFMTSVTEEIPFDGIMTRRASIKFSGPVTFTAGS